jgi:pre-60S factor REI1
MVEGENEEGMEVVYEDVSSEEEDDSDDELPASEITYGDTPYELVLPSGARIGHRAHTRIYKQNLAPYLNNNPFPATEHSSPAIGYKPSPHSKALLSLVPRMASDKSHARPLHDSGLIRTKNGNVIQARNKGEAKEAGKDMRKFRELKSYNDFALIRGMIGNSQKHVRYFFFSLFFHRYSHRTDGR